MSVINSDISLWLAMVKIVVSTYFIINKNVCWVKPEMVDCVVVVHNFGISIKKIKVR